MSTHITNTDSFSCWAHSLPSSHFWIPVLPATGTWTNKPIPAASTDCYTYIQISPKSAHWLIPMGFRSGLWGWGSPQTVLERTLYLVSLPLYLQSVFCLSLCPCAPLGLLRWDCGGLMAPGVAWEEPRAGYQLGSCLPLCSQNVADCPILEWPGNRNALPHLQIFFPFQLIYFSVIGEHLLFLLSIWCNLEEEWKASVLEAQTEALHFRQNNPHSEYENKLQTNAKVNFPNASPSHFRRCIEHLSVVF